MSTAANLPSYRPTLFPSNSGSMAASASVASKVQVLAGTAFTISVAGVAQIFHLGVLDGKMVILRPSRDGDNFVLRTDVPAGGQPKQMSDRAIARFTEMVSSPSAETTKFLRLSGALVPGSPPQNSPSQVPKASTAPQKVTVSSSFFSRTNGSDAFAASIAVPTGRGKDNVRFERIFANNVNGDRATSNSLAGTFGISPSTELISAVSSVRNEKTRAETTSLALAVRTNIKWDQFAVSAEARLLFNPQTGVVTLRPTVSATYTVPLKNGVYFDALLAARVPIPFGSTPGALQTAASVGIGYKTDTFTVQARFGTVFAGDAVNLNSANAVGGSLSAVFRF
jgi:hypothetical protein